MARPVGDVARDEEVVARDPVAAGGRARAGLQLADRAAEPRNRPVHQVADERDELGPLRERRAERGGELRARHRHAGVQVAQQRNREAVERGRQARQRHVVLDQVADLRVVRSRAIRLEKNGQRTETIKVFQIKVFQIVD